MNNINIEKKYLFQPVRGGAIAPIPPPPMDPPLTSELEAIIYDQLS